VQLGLGHDLLLDVGGHDVVVAELHRIAALAAGHAGQRPGVGGDFPERRRGGHRPRDARRELSAAGRAAARTP